MKNVKITLAACAALAAGGALAWDLGASLDSLNKNLETINTTTKNIQQSAQTVKELTDLATGSNASQTTAQVATNVVTAVAATVTTQAVQQATSAVATQTGTTESDILKAAKAVDSINKNVQELNELRKAFK